MKHFGLKFSHGVEIGARLAYLGHYKRTRDQKILEIADDELVHRKELLKILENYSHKNSKLIDGVFYFIGGIIFLLCQVSPNFLLDFIARLLEKFAVFSYSSLANKYPNEKNMLIEMARKEEEHEKYFTKDSKTQVVSKDYV